ncbi:hypothetical protein COCSUDRAFT_59762 [Coccomyxa subellipsoidea C-169]|uniref:F-box domain-containing protein n=1 Tax=Coccomyxa subellipsoidea (strain C-169) TaxID=574566 RepID=I0YKB2_COCSC|nr:hypothetical protein COCSUDRAFT_59762 [Coccomyxa subellipsoidea C-169]EIE18831.1 hypothetical protein COCSUDRAFT_59762 [Coccomyxa subellipsoidea C-169]|eukprot:XP_005643375.1 hypothetical protein COCSUDRAFT_59762 [Coccomyxa subellipsoidea C-169]
MEEHDNRAGGQGRTAVAFPPDVWRIIAGHLTLNEWARISGTCKTTWQLQLDELHLTWRQGLHAADRQYLGSLKAATIVLLSARTRPHSTAEVISLNSAIVWLLRSAANLDYLFLRTQELRCMPHLAQLRHLQLSLREDFRAVAQSLSNLKNLETLPLDQAHRVSPDEEADFDLTGIDKLQTVMLTNVVPASLLLPRGAELRPPAVSERPAQCHSSVQLTQPSQIKVWTPLRIMAITGPGLE